jgi:predicted RNA-binding protein with EMAP domain
MSKFDRVGGTSWEDHYKHTIAGVEYRIGMHHRGMKLLDEAAILHGENHDPKFTQMNKEQELQKLAELQRELQALKAEKIFHEIGEKTDNWFDVMTEGEKFVEESPRQPTITDYLTLSDEAFAETFGGLTRGEWADGQYDLEGQIILEREKTADQAKELN